MKTTQAQMAMALGVADEQAISVVSSTTMASWSGTPPWPVPTVMLDSVQSKGEFDTLLVKLLRVQLQALGLFNQTPVDVEGWKTSVGFPSLYDKWIEASLRVLVESGHLTVDGEALVLSGAQDLPEDAWTQWEQFKARGLQSDHLSAYIGLADVTLRALPNILQGKQQATAVMFPHASMSLLEGIYKNNATADYFNDVLAENLLSYVEARLHEDPQAKLRLIEVGAGTGGTSAVLFKRLAPYARSIAEYCYTDISRAFLLHGKKHHEAEAPYLTTRLLNVESPVERQGFDRGSYDVVIATNVLHATKNIRCTLGHAKSLLKGAGLLLLNEISTQSVFAHLTFGLLEGWWLYEDAALRMPGSPGLSPQGWCKVLKAEGFLEPAYPASEAHGFGQQVVMARSNGVIVHPTPHKAEELPGQDMPPARLVVAVRESAASDPVDGGGLSAAASTLRDMAIQHITKIVAVTLEVAPAALDASEPLGQYGLDSILALQMADALGEVFTDISSTLMFEYQTVEALADHFLSTQREAVQHLVGPVRQAATRHEAPASAVSKVMPAKLSLRKNPRSMRFMGTEELPHKVERLVSRGQDIAIIGLSGRYPQARTVQEFWARLRDGENCISEIPRERWDWQEYFSESKDSLGTMYSKWGGFISDVDAFDPLFFKISPLEAERMDPQERLFLQESYACITDAGHTPATLSAGKRIGVFVGAMNNGYSRMPTHWSIANRVSFTFGFSGPSFAVDTACSSSLTAIHLACESIHRGHSDCAIAGGVNLIIDPMQYVGLSMMNMLSPGDECRSFGAGADGFVDAEGVGAVLLKPLAKAIEDGDQIHGVIKSSAINHGGRTNGYTVPNPVAQTEVIAQALKASGVPARAVSYVEAHGTGTSLGDPIEIAGLSKAFGAQTSDTGYCAIGSAKSNIGHCESASGMAGLSKVLLQMKHQMLVPSLHSETLNPHIDFKSTPFVVQQELAPWKRPLVPHGQNGQTKEWARIAGLSSFGAGGSNAHLIIEEHPDQRPRGVVIVSEERPAVVVLSGKDEDRIKDQARQLLQAIEEGQVREDELCDLAYTLQVGREAHGHRLACVVESLQALKDKLAAYCGGQKQIDKLFVADIRSNKEALEEFAHDDDLEKMVAVWVDKGKLHKLAGLWVKGLMIDWRCLYPSQLPRRISLPTYPFARERHWLPAMQTSSASRNESSCLHPLVHRNTSELSEQRYSTRLSGQEWVLREHVVQGRRVMPGAAQLELARAAVALALGEAGAGARIDLEHVAFVRALEVGEEGLEVHIRLRVQDDEGGIGYEIYSVAPAEPEDQASREVVYSQGQAVVVDQEEGQQPVMLDVQGLMAGTPKVVSAQACYEVFDSMGLHYGPSFRALAGLRVGRDEGGQALVVGELVLPAPASQDSPQAYVLHPSMLDAALQACVGMWFLAEQASEGQTTVLPFALECLQVHAGLPAKALVVVRKSPGSEAMGTVVGSVQKLDVQVLDEQGTVCVSLGGFSSRVLHGPAVEQGGQVLVLGPCQEARPESLAQAILKQGAGQAHWLLACGPEAAQAAQAKADSGELGEASIQVVDLGQQAGPGQEAAHYEAQAQKLLSCLQEILGSKEPGPVLVQLVVAGEAGHSLGLAAMLKSAGQENPKIRTQVLQAQGQGQPLKVLAPGWQEVILEVGAEEAPQAHLSQDGGVYLITGGLGGLGLIFAKEIAQSSREVVLVLTGRSALQNNESGQDDARVQGLRDLGAKVEYWAVDVGQGEQIKALVQGVVHRHGKLNGVIHSAGVVRDSFVLKKTAQELSEVFQAKVAGVQALDEATAQQDLAYFVAFSSVAGVLGNAGQTDYAAANAYMDEYVRARAHKVGQGQRRGVSLTVNWPLWSQGGMQVDERVRQEMRRATGMVPLGTQQGVQALRQALSQGLVQAVVFSGDVARIKALVKEAGQPGTAPAASAEQSLDRQASSPAKGVPADVLQDKAQRYLKGLLSKTLNLAAGRIDVQAPLEQYGIDSVMAMSLTNALEVSFGVLSKTLFFEYQSIEALTQYFLQSHRDKLVDLLGLEGGGQPAEAERRPGADTPKATTRVALKGRAAASVPLKRKAPAGPKTGALDIAIIGLSGRYPKARTLQEYWRNLTQGVNCISEIPQSRWDAQSYFDAQKGKLGKSYSKWGGFVDGMEEFDPLFFNISPREAMAMDPQERLFLQCVHETLEDAGYTRQSLAARHHDMGMPGHVGVFVGVMWNEYQLHGAQSRLDADNQEQAFALSGNVSSIANRVSYYGNFHGPSLAVDTMCSSSLTAIHLACQNMANGSCEVAIAGGVNLTVHPNKYLVLSQGQFAASDGLCKSFGEGGDGYVPGEGVGAVLLKPLHKALEDGDQIHGVIKGSAINHGGKTNGYTVPNPVAQAQVIAKAIKESGIPARAVSYVEAHGTGTSLGDPIEITGLSKAFGAQTSDTGYCAIGSAKSNIGHCESASGMAGLSKVLLQMKHRMLVPSLHSETLNPHIDFKSTPFVVQRELAPWHRPRLSVDGTEREWPRIAGLSSFGAGGSNAHLIIEEYLDQRPRGVVPVSEERPAVVVLSGKDEDRLKEQARQLLQVMEQGQVREDELCDLAYTLQIGREVHGHRLACVVASLQELKDKLAAYTEGQTLIDGLYLGEATSGKEALSVFGADEDMVNALQSWIAKGKVNKLAQMWVKGLSLDWTDLHGQARLRRISLPTYPFAREALWMPSSAFIEATRPASPQRFASVVGGNLDEGFMSTVLDEVERGVLALDDAASNIAEKMFRG